MLFFCKIQRIFLYKQLSFFFYNEDGKKTFSTLKKLVFCSSGVFEYIFTSREIGIRSSGGFLGYILVFFLVDSSKVRNPRCQLS